MVFRSKSKSRRNELILTEKKKANARQISQRSPKLFSRVVITFWVPFLLAYSQSTACTGCAFPWLSQVMGFHGKECPKNDVTFWFSTNKIGQKKLFLFRVPCQLPVYVTTDPEFYTPYRTNIGTLPMYLQKFTIILNFYFSEFNIKERNTSAVWDRTWVTGSLAVCKFFLATWRVR